MSLRYLRLAGLLDWLRRLAKCVAAAAAAERERHFEARGKPGQNLMTKSHWDYWALKRLAVVLMNSGLLR